MSEVNGKRGTIKVERDGLELEGGSSRMPAKKTPEPWEGDHGFSGLALLAKTLGGNTQAPQEYWSDCRGYLFLVVRDGRNHELAVAIAPMAESPPATEGA